MITTHLLPRTTLSVVNFVYTISSTPSLSRMSILLVLSLSLTLSSILHVTILKTKKLVLVLIHIGSSYNRCIVYWNLGCFMTLSTTPPLIRLLISNLFHQTSLSVVFDTYISRHFVLSSLPLDKFDLFYSTLSRSCFCAISCCALIRSMSSAKRRMWILPLTFATFISILIPSSKSSRIKCSTNIWIDLVRVCWSPVNEAAKIYKYT